MQKILPKQNVHRLSRKTSQHVRGHLPSQRVVGTLLGALAPQVRIALQVMEIDPFPTKTAAAFPLR